MALSNKQKVFCAEYVKCWNASEAARRAGYSTRNADVIGSRLLVNVGISEVISRQLADIQMSADEVKVRLTEQARGSMADFVDAETLKIDLETADKLGKLHLLKSFSHTTGQFTDTVKIELYDAQAALALIGKMHKMFVDRSEVETTTRVYNIDIGSDGKDSDTPALRDDGAAEVLE